MSDRHEENPDNAIFRAAIPGRLSGMTRRPAGQQLLAPGRAALELSILFAALAILVPALVLCAVPLALGARRSGNTRWLAAVIAAVWCGFLGLVLRGASGMGILP